LGNNWIEITIYNVQTNRLPENFDKFKILLISDLQNKELGHDNYVLINKVIKIQPEIIEITGDLIDYKSNDIKILRVYSKNH